MKNNFRFILFSLFSFLLLLGSQNVYGQYFDNSQTGKFFGNFSIDGNVGVLLPFTDVSQDFNPYQDDWQLGYGIKFRKQFTPIFGIGGQFLMGDLHGTNVLPNNDIKYFDAEIMELNIHAIVNLSNLLFGYRDLRMFNLYGTIGVGIANWSSIYSEKTGTNSATVLNTFGFEGDKKAWTPVMSIPAALGIYMPLGKKFGFNLEGSVHRLNSDELDAHESGKSKQDYFAYISAGITYNVGAVTNVFRKSSKSGETEFEKEARKLKKYQDRQKRKDQKDRDRQKLAEDRKVNVERSRRSRRNTGYGMPKVVEYDASYSYQEIQKVEDQRRRDQEQMDLEVKGEKELVFDEGKHFITGGGKLATDLPTGSANIITAKDALKLKTNTYESITINDGTGRRSSTIISGGVLTIPESGKIYTVQILASRVPATNIGTYRQTYGIQQPIYYSLINGLYRYSAGLFTNYYDAQTYANVLKRNGLGDAFVATYNNGVRVLK